MMELSDDEALLVRFRRWLREARDEAEALDPHPDLDPTSPPPAPEVGLYRLAEEFTALRHEVKLQTKGARGLQDQAEGLMAALRGAIDEFRGVGPKEEQAARAASRPLADAIADLDEAMDRGRAEVERVRLQGGDDPSEAIAEGLEVLFARQPWYRRPWLRSYHRRALELVDRHASGARPALLDAMLEGYDLIRARLLRAMDAEGIRRIACEGEPVDPDLMVVVAVADAPDVGPGLVVDEVRRGYTWRGRVLRLAEVRAARGFAGGAGPPDEDEDQDED